MKFSTLAVAALVPTMAYGYNVGGEFRFIGRPFVIRGSGPCGPGVCGSDVDRRFDDLRNQVSSGNWGPNQRRRSRSQRPYQSPEEAIREQQEEMNKFLDVARGIANEFAAFNYEASNDMRQKQGLLDRAFGIASDAAVGNYSPSYEISDTKDSFHVALDVPGVPASSLDIRVDDDKNVLIIKGERKIGRGEEARSQKFSKQFLLSENANIDDIDAQLSQGVLFVTVPKVARPEPMVRKIPVVEVDSSEYLTGDPPAESNSIPILRKDKDENQTPGGDDDNHKKSVKDRK